MCVIVDVFLYISRIWHPIQTINTYLKFVRLRLTGSNSTNNIEMLQKWIILEPFYEIRNILDIRVKLSIFFHIHHQAFYLLCLNINKRLKQDKPVNFGFSERHSHSLGSNILIDYFISVWETILFGTQDYQVKKTRKNTSTTPSCSGNRRPKTNRTS